MANSIAFALGETTVTLAAGESIALYSATEAQVFESVGFPNYPVQLDLEATFTGYEVLGPYASGATLVLNPGATDLLYNIGTAPVVSGIANQGAPVARNAAIQLTAADVLGGLVSNTHATGATVALDLPNGVDVDAGTQLAVDEYFDWSIINLSAGAGDTVTLQVGVATTHTLVGSGVVAISSSVLFRTRKTAADTFVSYRIG
jgi:hypothetical protein